MATQRYISTSFWDDEVVQELSPHEKYLLVYCFTNTLTNMAGIYKITVKRICFDTGLDQDTVCQSLQKLETLKLLFYHAGYIIIPSWPTQQKYKTHSTIRTAIENTLLELSTELLSFLEMVCYQYPINTLCISPPQGPSYSDSDLDLDLDLDSNLTKEIAPPGERIPNRRKTPAKADSKFTPPTLGEITQYCQERKNGINPQQYLDFYTSKGWVVGKVKMKDWKASVRYWEKNSFQSGSNTLSKGKKPLGTLNMEEE